MTTYCLHTALKSDINEGWIWVRVRDKELKDKGINILDSRFSPARVFRMSTKIEVPETLMEAMKFFSEGDNAFDLLVSSRWPKGVRCPQCDSADVRFIRPRKIWECRHCVSRKQFSARVGTIFEDSAVPLSKWMSGFWLISNAKNGISSYEIGRSLGVTQKTGWFMLQRIRLAMQNGSFMKMSGHVEADETFIGGKARNMHKAARAKKVKGTGPIAMTPVICAYDWPYCDRMCSDSIYVSRRTT
jgi:transposase-like protein